MAAFIQIVNWDDRFENARSRELKVTEWFPMSNSVTHPTFKLMLFNQDGTQNAHGLTYWGIWSMILMLASNNPGKFGKALGRGVLVQENGRPHTALSIALQAFGGPDLVKRVNECIDLLISLNEIMLVDEDVLLGRTKILDQKPANLADSANKSTDAETVRDSGGNVAANPPPPGVSGETVRDSGRSLSTRGRARKELGTGKEEKGIGNSERKRTKNTTQNSARGRAPGTAQNEQPKNSEKKGSAAFAASPAPLAEGLAGKPQNQQPKKDTPEHAETAGEAAEPRSGDAARALGKGSNSTGPWVTSDCLDAILTAATGTPQEEQVFALLMNAETLTDGEAQKENVACAFHLLTNDDKRRLKQDWPELRGFWHHEYAQTAINADTLIWRNGRLHTDHVKAAIYLHRQVSKWTGLPFPSREVLAKDAHEAYELFGSGEMMPEVFPELVAWIGQHNVDERGRLTREFSWRLRVKSVSDVRRFWMERKFHGFSPSGPARSLAKQLTEALQHDERHSPEVTRAFLG